VLVGSAVGSVVGSVGSTTGSVVGSVTGSVVGSVGGSVVVGGGVTTALHQPSLTVMKLTVPSGCVWPPVFVSSLSS
jgi:hypothetical protein